VSGRIERYESRGARWEDEFVDDGDAESARRGRRPPQVEVLLDDPAFAVVLKPAGLPTVPERFAKDKRTVVDEVETIWKRADPDAATPIVCHRLDRDTSGCLVLAKDRATARTLMAAFEERRVSKTYLAIVLGAPQPPSGEVEFMVGPDKFRPGAMAIVEKRGKECRDAYETLETFRGLSLVRVRPQSGRTHEVRLALKHLGTPCAVDGLYGGREPILLSSFKRGYRVGRGRAELPLIDRLTLHAESIEFPHPTSGATVRVEAPPPRDFETTLRQLRRHAAPGSL
jgi:23S rRNA pseudouridine955/2504/2580 synthase/23S rRNA pseudouridine1911/1915/1917 synthase